MRSQDLESLKIHLQRRRTRIWETRRRADAEVDALRNAERDPEMEESAQNDHEQYNLSRIGEAERREIAEIDAALERMADGTYGVCQDCEADIGVKRLRALPTAALCAECAAARESSSMAGFTAPSPGAR